MAKRFFNSKPLNYAKHVRITKKGWRIVYNGETLMQGSWMSGPESFLKGWNESVARRNETFAMANETFRTYMQDAKVSARKERRAVNKRDVWDCALDSLVGFGRMTEEEARSLRFAYPRD